MRAVGVIGAATLGGYLLLVLLMAFGAPLPPAARLPMPADLGTGAAEDRRPEPQVGPAASTEAPAPATTRPVVPRSTSTGTASSATAGTPTPVTTTSRRSQRPSAPPGQGKQPTAPPGHG